METIHTIEQVSANEAYDIHLSKIYHQHTHEILEAINEKCRAFADQVRNGMVPSYKYDLARLYYDLALTFYNHYNQSVTENQIIKSNLTKIISCLNHTIERFQVIQKNNQNNVNLKKRINNIDLVKSSNRILNHLKARADFVQNKIQTLTKTIIAAATAQRNPGYTKIMELTAELIGYYLELGDGSKAEHYIKQFKKNAKDKFSKQAVVFEAQLKCLLTTNKIFDLETALISPQQEDLQNFIIQHPLDSKNYYLAFDDWRNKLANELDNCALFISNPGKNNQWEAWFYLGRINKALHQFIIPVEKSFTKFLQHYQNKPQISQLSAEVLELLAEQGTLISNSSQTIQQMFDDGQFKLKSSRDKIISICQDLSKAYDSIGHIPLRKFFTNAYQHYCKLKDANLKNIKRLLDPSSVKEKLQSVQTKKLKTDNILLSLFPKASKFGVTYLNETINETQLLTKIAPNIDNIKQFAKVFNDVYDIVWKTCDDETKLTTILTDWDKFVIKSAKMVPNQKYFLFVYLRNNKKWYFSAKANFNHTVETYLEQKPEFNTIVALLNEFNEKDIISGNKTGKLIEAESRIISIIKRVLNLESNNSNIEELNEKNPNAFISSLSLENYKNNYSSQTGIIIYNLENYTDCKKLKRRIKASKNTAFPSIVHLTENYYVVLLISSEISYSKEVSERKIYIIDSNLVKNSYELLQWLTEIADDCKYTLEEVTCNKQREMSNDSLLHAYVNANAIQYALFKNNWEFLKTNFYRQEFSSSENIEKIKLWFLANANGPNIAIETIDKQPDVETLLQKLRDVLIEIFTENLAGLKPDDISQKVDQLKNKISEIKRFDALLDLTKGLIDGCEQQNKDLYFNSVISIIEEFKQANLKPIDSATPLVSLQSLIDLFIDILLKTSINILEKQEELIKKIEIFEHALCELILNVILKQDFSKDNIFAVSIRNLYNDLGNNNFAKSKKNFPVELYKNFITKLNQLPEFLQAKNVSAILLDLQNFINSQKNPEIFAKLFNDSWANIGKYLDRFVNAEIGIKDIQQVFPGLLFHNYELLALEIIHKEIRSVFHNWLSNAKEMFAPMQSCFTKLINKAEKNIGIEARFDFAADPRKIQKAFEAFNELIKQNDQKSAMMINMHIRKFIMTKLDEYTKSVASFRYKTNLAIEKFESHAHAYFLESIKQILNSTEIKTALKFVANQAKTFLDKIVKNKNDLSNSLIAYKKFIEYLIGQNVTIPPQILSTLAVELNKDQHSHYSYIALKMADIKAMILRFAELELLMPNFSKFFEEFLNSCYDHLDEHKVCAPNGKIAQEIFNQLKPTIGFADIRKIIGNKHAGLLNILSSCDQFLNESDDKASAEISECIRQNISDTTNNYVRSLLAFRTKALLTLNQFERELFNVLSSYECTKNNNLRNMLAVCLSKLQEKSGYGNYVNFKTIYLNIIDIVSKNNLEEVQLKTKDKKTDDIENHINPLLSFGLLNNIKNIFANTRHTIKPHINERWLNLTKLIDGYVNWCPAIKIDKHHHIAEIYINTALLSKVIERIKQEKNDVCTHGNEIIIASTNILFVDIDLNGPEYSGVNVAITAPLILTVPLKKNKFTIVTSGKDAEEVWNGDKKCAASGNGYDATGKGNSGSDGADGKNGKNAGYIYVVSNNSLDMETIACGGQGGRGQDGGNGAGGYNGKDGTTPDENTYKDKYKREWAGTWISHAYRAIVTGTDGEKGGRGGNAGYAGYGGQGGDKGEVKIAALDNPYYLVATTHTQGDQGKPGMPGKPGEAGNLGEDGTDLVLLSHSRSAWSIFSFLFEDRPIDDEEKGRVTLANMPRGSERAENFNKKVLYGVKVPFPPMYNLAEAKQLFQQKQQNHKIHNKGQAGGVKHTRAEQKEHAKSIRKKYIFNQLNQFFKAYTNPNNKQSYQHWLAPQLNQFLQKLAQLENFPACKIHDLPDVDLQAQQIQMLEDQFTNTVSALNQRLINERINTEQLKIGNAILSAEILQQQENFAQEHQNVQKALEESINSINVTSLSFGLNKYEYNIRTIINQFASQQRLQKQESRKEHTSVLIEMEQADSAKKQAKLHHLNFSQTNKTSKKLWIKFEPELSYTLKTINDFNKQPNEDNLLKLGNNLLNLMDGHHNGGDSKYLKCITNIILTYFDNFSNCQFAKKHIEILGKQKERCVSLLSRCKNNQLNIIVNNFIETLSKEYIRWYWILRINRTQSYYNQYSKVANSAEINHKCSDVLRAIKKADDYHLTRYNSELKSCNYLIKEFPQYHFPVNNNISIINNLNNAITNFNNNYDAKGMLAVITYFWEYIKHIDIDLYQKLLADNSQLSMLRGFFAILKFNNKLMQLNVENNEKIKEITQKLIGFPYSIIHDMVLDKKHDSSNYPNPLKANLVDRVNIFLASPNLDNIVEVFNHLEQGLNIEDNKSKIIDLIKYLIVNINQLNPNHINEISKILDKLIDKVQNLSLSNKISLLRLVLNYKKINIPEQKKSIELEKINDELVKELKEDCAALINSARNLNVDNVTFKDDIEILFSYLHNSANSISQYNLEECTDKVLFAYGNKLIEMREFFNQQPDFNKIVDIIVAYISTIKAESKNVADQQQNLTSDEIRKNVLANFAETIKLCEDNLKKITLELANRIKTQLKVSLDQLIIAIPKLTPQHEDKLVKLNKDFSQKNNSFQQYFLSNNRSLDNLHHDKVELIQQFNYLLVAAKLKEDLKPSVKGNLWRIKQYDQFEALFIQYYKLKGQSPIQAFLENINFIIHIVNYCEFADKAVLDCVINNHLRDFLANKITTSLLEIYVLQEVICDKTNKFPNYIKNSIRHTKIDNKINNFDALVTQYQSIFKLVRENQVGANLNLLVRLENFANFIEKLGYKEFDFNKIASLAALIIAMINDNSPTINIIKNILIYLFENEEGCKLIYNDAMLKTLSWIVRFSSMNKDLQFYQKLEVKLEQVKALKQLDLFFANSNSQYSNSIMDFLRDAQYQVKLVVFYQYYNKLLAIQDDSLWIDLIFSTEAKDYLDITQLDEYFNKLINQSTKIKINKFKEIIFAIVSKLQSNKIISLQKIISDSLKAKNEEFVQQFKKSLAANAGFIESFIASQRKTPDIYSLGYALKFNKIINIINEKLQIDGGLLISKEIFFKVLEILGCFQDLDLAIKPLTNIKQNNWVKALLVENIIDKYLLLFSTNEQNRNELDLLRSSLMTSDEKLLLLFSNILITEYSAQLKKVCFDEVKSVEVPVYQEITNEKFLSIVDYMKKLKIDNEFLETLAGISLAIWDSSLYEYKFNQKFNKKFSNLPINNLPQLQIDRCLLYLNRIRVNLGIEKAFRFYKFFAVIIEKLKLIKSINNETVLSNLIKVLHAINTYQITFDEGFSIVSTNSYDAWEKEITKTINNTNLDNEKDRTIDEIFADIQGTAQTDKNQTDKNSNKGDVFPSQRLLKVKQQANDFCRIAEAWVDAAKGNEKSFIAAKLKEIVVSENYKQDKENYILTHLAEVVPLILYAWYIASHKIQFPKNTQIVSFLLFINSSDKGLLQQIKTGEGKTLIVGLIAAFKALCGYAVDIVSSNRDLAIEGEHKCRAFFELLGLKSGHNCHDSDENNKQAYQTEIVYGEVGGFQRDILETKTKNKDTFGERYQHERKKCLIVDEVDNMCLDKARHVLYLSHEIESLKWLESVFINIWIATLKADISKPEDIEKHVEDIAKFISVRIRTKEVAAPSYLFNYIDLKVKRWVESAFQARFMCEDDQFVIDEAKGSDPTGKKQKAIIVVDKDTGVEQYSTRWSNGLAQFLELKYRRRLSPESLKAVFISNKTFFQHYGSYLYGLTGTLGSENSRAFLAELYKVQFIDLPTSKRKRYVQVASRICDESDNLFGLIIQEIEAYSKSQPVLIICENVDNAMRLKEELINTNVVLAHNIYQYIRDGDDIERRFREKPAMAGDIIIATNKGGRGTDIEVDKKVNSAGGLHVILTYLPDNVRTEDQAFGRTARNGNKGSGQFILKIDLAPYREMYKLIGLTGNQLQNKLDLIADLIIEREKSNRDAREAARLSQLKQKNILHLDIEQKLFAQFEEFKSSYTEFFKSIASSAYNDPKTKEAETIQNMLSETFKNILNDRWAFWLDSIKELIDNVEDSSQEFPIFNKFKNEFIATIKFQLNCPNIDVILEKFVQTPEEAIKIGKVFTANIIPSMTNLSSIAANQQIGYKCFAKANALGDVTGFAAMALANNILNQENPNKHKLARHYIKEAINIFEEIKRNLMANLKTVQLLAQMSSSDVLKTVSSKENLYENQITGRLDVIGIHLHYLKQAIGENIDSFDFIEEGKEATPERVTKSKGIYELLISKGIIQGDVVRKTYQTTPAKMLEIIKANIDPSVSQEIYDFLVNKKDNRVTKEDLAAIVCSNDELWEALKLKVIEEEVFILNIQELEKSLEQKFENLWQSELKPQIDPNNVSLKLFEGTPEKVEFKQYVETKELLVKTKRVPLAKFDPNQLVTTDRFSKYGKVIFNQAGQESKKLVDFLGALKNTIANTQIHPEKPAYLYQNQLPFGSRDEEAAKIYLFLKEQNILKSGGIIGNDYKKKFIKFSGELNDVLDKILKDTPYQVDKDFIKRKLTNLQGDLRQFEDVKSCFKKFEDLKELENYPSELKFFENMGLGQFLIIEEDKGWWDWGAFAVIIIGVLQIIAGAILSIIPGLQSFGSALISEGINDITYATVAWISGKFSWKDWLVQKAISFSISIATAGIQTLAAIGKTVSKLGSVSTMALVAKVLVKSAINFATTMLTNLLSQGVMESIKRGVIDKIIKGTIDKLLDQAGQFIKSQLEALSQKIGFASLEMAYNEIKAKIETLFASSKTIVEQFDNIRNQVASVVQETLKSVLNGFKNSSSTIVKVASTVLDVASVITNTWNIVDSVLKGVKAAENFVNALRDIFDKITNYKHQAGNADQSEIVSFINGKVDKLKGIIKKFIDDNLIKLLEKLLEQAVSGTLGNVINSVSKSAQDFVDTAFKSNNPLRDVAQEQKINAYVVDAISNANMSKEARLAKLEKQKNELLRTSVQSLTQVAKGSMGDIDITPIKNVAEDMRQEFNKLKGNIESTVKAFDFSQLKQTYEQIESKVTTIQQDCSKMSDTVVKQLDQARQASAETVQKIENLYKQNASKLQSQLTKLYQPIVKELEKLKAGYQPIIEWSGTKLTQISDQDVIGFILGKSAVPLQVLKSINITEVQSTFHNIVGKFSEISAYNTKLFKISYNDKVKEIGQYLATSDVSLKVSVEGFKSNLLIFDKGLADLNLKKITDDINNTIKQVSHSKHFDDLKDYFIKIDSEKSLNTEFTKQMIDFKDNSKNLFAEFSNIEKHCLNISVVVTRLKNVQSALGIKINANNFKNNPKALSLARNILEKIKKFQIEDNKSLIVLSEYKNFTSKITSINNYLNKEEVQKNIVKFSNFISQLHSKINVAYNAFAKLRNFDEVSFNRAVNNIITKLGHFYKNYTNDYSASSKNIIKRFSDARQYFNAAADNAINISQQYIQLNSIINTELAKFDKIKTSSINEIIDLTKQLQTLNKNFNVIDKDFNFLGSANIDKMRHSLNLIDENCILLKDACNLEKPQVEIFTQAISNIVISSNSLKEIAQHTKDIDFNKIKDQITESCTQLVQLVDAKKINVIEQLHACISDIDSIYINSIKSMRNIVNKHLSELSKFNVEFNKIQMIAEEFSKTIYNLSNFSADITAELQQEVLSRVKIFQESLLNLDIFIVDIEPPVTFTDNILSQQMANISNLFAQCNFANVDFSGIFINKEAAELKIIFEDMSAEQINILQLDQDIIEDLQYLAKINFNSLYEYDYSSSKSIIAALTNGHKPFIDCATNFSKGLQNNIYNILHAQLINLQGNIKMHFNSVINKYKADNIFTRIVTFNDKLNAVSVECDLFLQKLNFAEIGNIFQQFSTDKNQLELFAHDLVKDFANNIKKLTKSLNDHTQGFIKDYGLLIVSLKENGSMLKAINEKTFAEILPDNKLIKHFEYAIQLVDNIPGQLDMLSTFYKKSVQELKAQLEDNFKDLKKHIGCFDKFCEDISQGITPANIEKLGMGLHKPAVNLAKKLTDVNKFFNKNNFKQSFWQSASNELKEEFSPIFEDAKLKFPI